MDYLCFSEAKPATLSSSDSHGSFILAHVELSFNVPPHEEHLYSCFYYMLNNPFCQQEISLYTIPPKNIKSCEKAVSDNNLGLTAPTNEFVGF